MRERATRFGRTATTLGTGAAVATMAAACRAPSVVFADAGELLTAVVRGGVAHPPGFPLYLLFGGFWLTLTKPFGLGPASSLNLFSSVCDGAAAALMVCAAQALLDRTTSSLSEGSRRLLAVLAGLLAGFGPTLFDFSLSIEVYAIHAVCLSGALACSIAAGGEAHVPGRRLLTAGAGLFVGGGLAVHHATMVVIIPGLLLLLWRDGEEPKERRRRLLFLAGGSLPGILSYLLLPLRATLAPPLNWGNPSNLFRFWVHVSARDYQVNIESSVEKTLAHAGRFLHAYGSEFSLFGLAIAAAGLSVLLVRQRLAGWGLLAAALGDVAFAVRYEIAEDQAAYYIPVFLVTALAFAAGAAFLAELPGPARVRGRRAILTVIAVAAFGVGARNVYGRSGRRFDLRAPEAAANLLASSPPGALVFITEWNLYSPTLAAQEVDGLRDDVVALDILLLRRGWYLDALARRWAVRLTGAEDELRRYRAKLADWEEGRPFQPEELTALYEAFTKKLIERAWGRGLDVVWVGSVMGQHLPAKAALVPSGIGYRVLPNRDAAVVWISDAAVSFAAAGRDGLPKDDVFDEKVRPLLTGMRLQRALYDDAFGRRAEAREALAQARHLSPADAAVEEVEGDFLLREGRVLEALEKYADAARNGGDAARLAEKSRAAKDAAKTPK